MNSSHLTRWLLAGCLVIALTTIAFIAGLAAGFGLGRWTAPTEVAAPAGPLQLPTVAAEAPRSPATPTPALAPRAPRRRRPPRRKKRRRRLRPPPPTTGNSSCFGRP